AGAARSRRLARHRPRGGEGCRPAARRLRRTHRPGHLVTLAVVCRTPSLVGRTSMTARYTFVPSPIGDVLLVSADGEALSRLWLPPAAAPTDAIRDDDLPVLAEAR